MEDKERKAKHLIIAISSDRGLCGSIHSGIARNIRNLMPERPAGSETAIVCVGDKMRTIMQRFFRANIFMHFQEYGRAPPMFAEASFVAEQILNSGLEYDSAELIYNRFRCVYHMCVLFVTDCVCVCRCSIQSCIFYIECSLIVIPLLAVGM